VGEIAFTAPGPGKVLVRFEGYCIADVGDRIVVAASDDIGWDINNGNQGLEIYTEDENRRPFSHSRTYPVNTGNYTFYAVAHNTVEMAGSGVTSLYGSLTVKYFPDSEPEAKMVSQGVDLTGINLRGAPVELAQVNLDAPVAGTVVVHFDGNCYVSPGDRLLMAASDAVSWGVNNGHSPVEAFDADVNIISFSHTRSYPVAAGNHTFYAVGENYVEEDGNGFASVYGHLSAEFYPSTAGSIQTEHAEIIETNTNLRGAPVALAQIDFEAPSAGQVLVHFDGFATASVGDRLLMAASDVVGWTPNDGQVSMEAPNADVSSISFSHTRLYDVEAGNHSFYAVGENYVELDGSGIASVYGNFTLSFYPAEGANSIDDPRALAWLEALTIAPNPSRDLVRISGEFPLETDLSLRLIDLSGKALWQRELTKGIVPAMEIDLQALPAGVYLLQFSGQSGVFSRRVVKQ
jgi:hypothetical protein